MLARAQELAGEMVANRRYLHANPELGMDLPKTTAFSYISDKVPSMFLWLGAGGKDNYSLHNPNVVFDESALPVGAAVLANCAINWLKDNA